MWLVGILVQTESKLGDVSHMDLVVHPVHQVGLKEQIFKPRKTQKVEIIFPAFLPRGRMP